MCPRCQISNLECLPDHPVNHEALSEVPSDPNSATRTEISTEVSLERSSTSSDQPSISETSPLELPVHDQDRARDESNHVSVNRAHGRTLRPPLLLDTAICVLLVLVVGLVYRRVL